jgi:hypothetical protein
MSDTLTTTTGKPVEEVVTTTTDSDACYGPSAAKGVTAGE